MATPPPSARRAHAASSNIAPPLMSSTPPPLVSTADACAAPEMTPSLADKKRLKHREYVKKSYNKKISTIESLKSELEALERQYATLLSATSAASHASSSSTALSSTAVASQHESPLMRKYMQLADMKRRLQRENDALYQTNAQHMKVEGRMHQLLHTETQLPRVAAPFRIHPLPAAEYSKVIAEARDDILRFMYAPGKLSSGASVFGWTDQRQISGTSLKFALEKSFDSLSAFELLRRSWAIFSSPEQFPKVYSPALHVRFHELQRVNDDTVLFYRTIDADGSSVRVKTVFVLARLKIAEGYMLLFRSIDRGRVGFSEDDVHAVVAETQALVRTNTSGGGGGGGGRQDLWVDKYIWVIFKDRGPESCVFHFGGSTTTSIWLKEVLFIALKWEALAVGPQITLTM